MSLKECPYCVKNLFANTLLKFEVQFQGIVKAEKRDVNTAMNRTVSTSCTIAEVFRSVKGPSLCNCQKPVSALRDKKGGVCFDLAHATGLSVPRHSLVAQSMYLYVPRLRISHDKGAYRYRHQVSVKTFFSSYDPCLISLHWCSNTLPVGTDAEAAGSVFRADPDPVLSQTFKTGP
jgi:hypothetical protein